MISTGFVLRQYRELYGLKQWWLASQLGYSSAFLCAIEKGHKPLTPEIRVKAEKIFNKEKTKQNRVAEPVQILIPAEA